MTASQVTPSPPMIFPAKPRTPAPAFWVLSGILALSVLLPRPGPDSRIAHLPPLCPFYALTGLPCPGCGLTRAFVCLGHGQVAQSLHWHPLGIVVYVVCVLAWANTGARWLRGRPFFSWDAVKTERWAMAGVVVLLTYGVARIVGLVLRHGTWPS